MNEARDPYLGLNNHIRQQAREQTPAYYAIGKVLSLRPLKIRADGLDLDRDDLCVPESMYSNFIRTSRSRGAGFGQGCRPHSSRAPAGLALVSRFVLKSTSMARL